MSLDHERVVVIGSTETMSSVVSQQLENLRGRFPGMQQDERVKNLFCDPETGIVSVIGLDGAYDPIQYQLGGSVDSDVQAIRDHGPGTSGRPPVGFYKAGEIWQK